MQKGKISANFWNAGHYFVPLTVEGMGDQLLLHCSPVPSMQGK
jgi:hypothetical protein